ncbi:MAG: glycosyltransferase [Chitinophagaceae bacterium]|nr:glycosyltransferase [Chitinophagaceae bacterium]
MTILLFVLFILLIVYGILTDYYRRAWNAIPEFLPEAAPVMKISVIVAVRNEEKNIERLLNCLYRQDYPRDLYEVIIIDDHSTDNTAALTKAFDHGDLTITCLKLAEGSTSKKTAIATGVGIASGEIIFTTDADCEMNPSWISILAAYFESTNARFVAAPVRMKSDKTLLGIFQSLDFLMLQGITGASVSRRFHSMCNGANLAYTKAAFNEVNGFDGIDTIPSGDDMLLMHKIFLKYPHQVFYLKNKNAIVTTEAERSWKDFFNQRIRWASKATHYKDRKIFYVLLLIYLINICFLGLAIASAIHYNWLMFLLLFLIAKIIIEFPFVNAVSMFFGQSSLMVYFPFLQPLHIIYTIIAGWLGKFGSYKWKSRIIKNN